MKEKIAGFYLDQEQEAIVFNKSKYLLVVAGAGSGKTLTILGKIYDLLKYQNIRSEEILCISFTKKAATSLKEKIQKEFSINMPVYTFHKLSLEILKENQQYFEIAEPELLEHITMEFFRETILQDSKQIFIFFTYFHYRVKKEIKEEYLCFYQEHRKEIHLLEKLIITFLHLFKCNHHTLEDFSIFSKKIKRTFSYRTYQKEKSFLILALNIYLIYQKYLKENQEIDFDDMILKATSILKETGHIKKYRYVIIDEYQDTSLIRFQLVKTILEKTDANLMVVGDDFQSIYRFTGCELSLFLNFKHYFPTAKVMKIQNTYRNSQELIQIAGDFVMKNKKQIPKKLHSHKSLKNPIQIVYYDQILDVFEKLVVDVYEKTQKPILILGRNNQDIYSVCNQNFQIDQNGKICYLKNINIKLSYLTVHKSKGLEEENVILIHLKNELLGFPNQISDEKILRLVSIQSESYPYSEERRLFYVALTRTKNKVYLLVPKKNPSIFVKEIKKKKDVIEIHM